MDIVENILVIDDIRETREGLSKLLSSYGYLTDTATNGYEALIRVKTKKYDFVFVDMILPDTNGVDLMKKINQSSPSTFLILTYDKLDDKLRERIGKFTKKGGHFHFLEKPLSEDKVIRAIKSKSYI